MQLEKTSSAGEKKRSERELKLEEPEIETRARRARHRERERKSSRDSSTVVPNMGVICRFDVHPSRIKPSVEKGRA